MAVLLSVGRILAIASDLVGLGSSTARDAVLATTVSSLTGLITVLVAKRMPSKEKDQEVRYAESGAFRRQLSEEATRLSNDATELRKELKEARDTHFELQKKYVSYRAESEAKIYALTVKCEGLKQSHDSLRESYDNLKEMYEALQGDIRVLKGLILNSNRPDLAKPPDEGSL
jgi:chromosome segregation ATPase